MCVMRLRIRREKSGLLRDRMALERSALACPLMRGVGGGPHAIRRYADTTFWP
jgi:hypothetical protein